MKTIAQLLCGLILFCASCTGPWKARQPTVHKELREYKNDVVVYDRSLGGWFPLNTVFRSDLTVDAKRASVTPDGRLKVEVQFKNNLSKQLNLQVQTVFFGRHGFHALRSNELGTAPRSKVCHRAILHHINESSSKELCRLRKDV